MDPDETLSEILEIAEQHAKGNSPPHKLDELVDLVLALDTWLRRGGYLPTPWESK
jgi:hypothetical protein